MGPPRASACRLGWLRTLSKRRFLQVTSSSRSNSYDDFPPWCLHFSSSVEFLEVLTRRDLWTGNLRDRQQTGRVALQFGSLAASLG